MMRHTTNFILPLVGIYASKNPALMNGALSMIET